MVYILFEDVGMDITVTGIYCLFFYMYTVVDEGTKVDDVRLHLHNIY